MVRSVVEYPFPFRWVGSDTVTPFVIELIVVITVLELACFIEPIQGVEPLEVQRSAGFLHPTDRDGNPLVVASSRWYIVSVPTLFREHDLVFLVSIYEHGDKVSQNIR